MTPLRPALVCRALLAALDASDGRRRRRKRDTTPDAIGMSLKRRLLAEAIEQDPDPEAFDTWLLERCLARAEAVPMGAMRAMARDVLETSNVGSTLAPRPRIADDREPALSLEPRRYGPESGPRAGR